MKQILFNPELDDYNTVIISLGPGTQINEYLPDYALEAEEYDQRNVLIFPIEPDTEGFGVLSREQILQGYMNKRQQLFQNPRGPGRLNVADVVDDKLLLVSNLTNDSKYYGVATIVLIKTGFNPAMHNKIVILQCGISPEKCHNMFNKALNYHLKVDIYISVRGSSNLMYKVLNKNGGVKFNDIQGQNLAGWDQLKQYLMRSQI